MAHNFDSSSSSSSSSSCLVPPLIAKPSKVDLESGLIDHIQCRICLETHGRDFIAPCKCKGTSKYVHRECLDQWRAVKIVASLGYLVYVIDKHQMFWLRLHWGFGPKLSFYYICGALLFFALMGVSGCFLACFDESVRNDLGQPCRNVLSCCSCNGLCADCHRPRTGRTYICIDSNICSGNCSNSTCECCSDCECGNSCTDCECGNSCTDCECGNCFGGDGDEPGNPVLLIVALIVLGLFAIFGMFYSVLVATMVGQRIWQRHYHILEKRMLTKEYVVEDVGEVAGYNWSPPPLPQQHVQQLEALGLL
ncbi:uncharacterized protein LOC132068452 isoform X3 [Lycium ferocissimum]|uniref:uncharacterized protein LOC132068452 isoform X3 n=1 Tax=Lycium ferocissimum TaxID=112874 RepID=UPI002815965A|nr:uncharacterized protein LOC132068452 isoform X3 [Lycium ferocissimum]